MKRKTQNANIHKKVESAKKSRSNQNFPKIPIESTRCDSELKIIDFFDLSQDDDECSDENKKAQNEIIENNDDINDDLLGKKRKRAIANNPKINNIFLFIFTFTLNLSNYWNITKNLHLYIN